jgi:hypothetical protein
MQRVAIGNNWFFDANLVPFLRFVAGRAKYDLLPEEEQAIKLGIRETDQERQRWYDYEFPGETLVRLSFAVDPGSSVVFWRGECPVEVREAIETAAGLMQEYQLSEVRLSGGPAALHNQPLECTARRTVPVVRDIVGAGPAIQRRSAIPQEEPACTRRRRTRPPLPGRRRGGRVFR